MPKIVHFEISVDDMERAVAFYTKVLGWRIRKEHEENYWLIEDNPDSNQRITGGLVQRSCVDESTIIIFDVASLNDTTRKIAQAGGKILHHKISLPGVGYVQYCVDSEGNMFAILQCDESAQISSE